MLRKLAVLAGWAGAAFAVQMAFWMATFDGPDAFVVATYAIALGTTFALHRATRGPLILAVAFGFAWALFVEGITVLAASEPTRPRERGIFALFLALPLVALVIRRLATDAEDAWFRRYVRLAAPLSLVIALPLLAAGAVGSARNDPVPYDRARRVLVDGPFAFDFWLYFMGASETSPCRFDLLRSPRSDVDPAVRDEVLRACDRFAQNDPRRACRCMNDLLVSRSHAERKRRDRYLSLALLSSLPLGIALLFAWRGRRL